MILLPLAFLGFALSQPAAPKLRQMPDGSTVIEAADGRRCHEIQVSLPPGSGRDDRDEIYGKSPCPGPERVQPNEHVVIEGLDQRGRRLWLARGWDSRFARSLTGPVGEGHETSIVSRGTITTLITAPVPRSLARLRWYAVEPGYKLRLIGTTRWEGVRAR